MIYVLVNKYLMHDFTSAIADDLNKKNHKETLKILDIGCFQGNFSRNLKKKIKQKADFFLFDPNPNLKIDGFNYVKLAFSNEIGLKTFYLNTFFPAAGSSLKTIFYDDRLWNFTRKLFTGNFKKKYITLRVNTDTLDNYCQKNKIKKIDVLKIDTEGSEVEVLEGAKNILKNTNILLIEVLDTKKGFEKKYIEIIDFLEKKYNFKKVSEKKIWSLETLSNMKAVDLMFKNQ